MQTYIVWSSLASLNYGNQVAVSGVGRSFFSLSKQHDHALKLFIQSGGPLQPIIKDLKIKKVNIAPDSNAF